MVIWFFPHWCIMYRVQIGINSFRVVAEFRLNIKYSDSGYYRCVYNISVLHSVARDTGQQCKQTELEERLIDCRQRRYQGRSSRRIKSFNAAKHDCRMKIEDYAESEQSCVYLWMRGMN